MPAATTAGCNSGGPTIDFAFGPSRSQPSIVRTQGGFIGGSARTGVTIAFGSEVASRNNHTRGEFERIATREENGPQATGVGR